MSNTLNPFSPTMFSAAAGNKLYKTNVYKNLANFKEEANLYVGRVVDRPHRSDVTPETYTPGTAATAQDLTATSNTMTIDEIKDILMYVDDVNKIQNKYDAAKLWGEEAGIRLGNVMDGRFLYEAINASDTIDSGDIGGTNGEGISLSTSNIISVFGEAAEKLDALDVPMEERFAVISPLYKNKLWQYIAGRESQLGDRSGEYGNIGTYDGFQLYLSNNTTASARWTPADNPSDEDTITVNGITFTFQSVIGTTAGNILQTTSLAVTIDNLVALINADGVGDEVNYYSLSAANKRTVSNWVAVDGTTYIEIRAQGITKMTVSGSVSADTWDAKWQEQRLMFGRKKCVDFVGQKYPSVQTASTVSAGKAGLNILLLALYNAKTFYQGAYEMMDVQIRTDS